MVGHAGSTRLSRVMMMKPARPPDLPENPLERAELLQNMLIAHATDGAADDATYKFLRSDFMSAEATARLLPKFVRRVPGVVEVSSTVTHR